MDFKIISRIAVLWICCASISHLFAQQKEIVSRLYTMNDGLPEDGITCVIQDSQGFIWLGTNAGISRFDGMSFTNYSGLRNNAVQSILEDKKGRLWIGHAEGLDVFDPKSEKIFFRWPNSKNEINADHLVWTLRERKNGQIWICTKEGVYVGDPESFGIEKFHQIPTWTYDIAETKDGSIVTASGAFGVYYHDAKSNVTSIFLSDFRSSHGSTANRSSHYSRTVKVDKYDRIWIGTNECLELFNPRENPECLFLLNPLQVSFKHYPTKVGVFSIEETLKRKLWLGLADSFCEFDLESAQINRLTNDSYVRAIFRDKQGTVWTASTHGLKQIISKNKQFRIYRQFGDLIGSMAEDANRDLWILGHNNPNAPAALFKFNLSLGTIHDYGLQGPLDFRSVSGDSLRYLVRSLFIDKDKNIWLASPWSLERYDAKARMFHLGSNYTFDGGPNSSFMDSDGMVWLANSFGIYRFDPVTERNRFFPIGGSSESSFLEDSSRNVWIGSMAGLTRYNMDTGKTSTFKNIVNDQKSLSNNIVHHLMMDREKNIWIGTSGGLNKMIKGTENDVPKFLNWRRASSGLPNDNVYSIVSGEDGTLWMTCGNMISHFIPSQNSFRNYDYTDGLSGANFRGLFNLSGSGLRSRTGHVLFGSTDGLIVFHPDSLNNNSYVPPIMITGFSVNSQTVPVENSDADTLSCRSPLTQAISFTRQIQLASDQNNFNFQFSALNFVNPERNLYKYKLEPYEKEWVETDADNRFARYTNISPGTYTFRVIGSNNEGVWNELGATLVLTITPPWWQTWWAYSLYALTFIGMFIYWRKYENKRITLKNRAEYLSELDTLKSRFFTNISHEFRTPITLILSPLKEMYNGTFTGDQKPVLGMMMRNGQRLLRLINQLLDLSKLEVGKMTLHAAPVDLVQFIREIASSYESLAADKKIRYFFYPEAQELIACIDEEKIEKVVHNLLSNAFKFTLEGGEVILNLKVQEKQWVVISVKDTGIGIPADQVDKIFDRFYQVNSSQTREYEGSGLGMALTKELVLLHHGRIALESTVGKGTAFTVLLPLGKEHLRKDQVIEAENPKKSKLFSADLMKAQNFVEAENEVTSVSSNHQHIVLIVEDNTDMRNYIRKILSSHCQIVEAENGKEALKMALEIIPDLIISDLMMPEMDGYSLCETIKSRELTSHIPIILLTAKADHESKLAGLETGADDYVSKPFYTDELKLIVRNRIEARNKMKERFSRDITLEPREISITSFDEKFLQKLLSIIEAHMDDENFSIEELSREVGYSNMHLYRKIKALAGQTPSQFIRTIRLKRAAALLSKESDNVAQIAYSVGFSNLSYFNKCFKQQFGTTPGKFAELNHAN